MSKVTQIRCGQDNKGGWMLENTSGHTFVRAGPVCPVLAGPLFLGFKSNVHH